MCTFIVKNQIRIFVQQFGLVVLLFHFFVHFFSSVHDNFLSMHTHTHTCHVCIKVHLVEYTLLYIVYKIYTLLSRQINTICALCWTLRNIFPHAKIPCKNHQLGIHTIADITSCSCTQNDSCFWLRFWTDGGSCCNNVLCIYLCRAVPVSSVSAEAVNTRYIKYNV